MDDAGVSGVELLARLEERTVQLSRARVRGRKLERALRAELERREQLEVALDAERERGAELERALARRDAEVETADAVQRDLEQLHGTVQALEDELRAAHMQLEAVRGELAARRPLAKRLHPRSWR